MKFQKKKTVHIKWLESVYLYVFSLQWCGIKM